MTPRQANRGLTLMEILVVLVIVAVVTGFAVLATSSLGGDTPQEKAARHIAALIELASENAVMEGKQFGVEIQPHGYRFFRYANGSWRPIEKNSTFRQRDVDDNVVLRLNLQGHRITLPQPVTSMMAVGLPGPASRLPAEVGSDGGEDTQKTRGPKPQILALSSGELTPFRLEVAGSGNDASYRVRGHMSGKIQLIPPDSRMRNR